MKKSGRRIIGGLLLLAGIALGCGGVEKPVADEVADEVATARVPTGRVPQTLAIFPFENNSVSDPPHFEPLSKGLAAMLITDLNKQESGLKLIERDKISALLQEIALGQSGAVDQATAMRAGRILGAQAIAFGSFMVLADQVRIDLRIVNVETSEMILADSILGSSDAFIELEARLAGKIARSLQIAFKPEATTSKGTIEAALYFSRGVDALDQGKRDEARSLFEQCVAIDPAYRYQVDSLKGLN